MFDWRVLGGVAVAVGMLGVILGIFVALPLMLAAAGVHVDWGVVAGLIINLLVAAGTFAAAGTAVWVATTDRRERQRERVADDATQARLVIVEAYCQENPLELQIKVTNNGARAIVALTFVQIEVEGHDLDLQPTAGPFPVIAPPAASMAGSASHTSAGRSSIPLGMSGQLSLAWCQTMSAQAWRRSWSAVAAGALTVAPRFARLARRPAAPTDSLGGYRTTRF